MRTVNYTSRFNRDYRREKSGRHGKNLDTLLMEVVDMLAEDTPLPRRNLDHPLTDLLVITPDMQRAGASFR